MVERVFAGYFAERAVPYRHDLSPTETEILRYLAHGLNCTDIARLRRSRPDTRPQAGQYVAGKARRQDDRARCRDRA